MTSPDPAQFVNLRPWPRANRLERFFGAAPIRPGLYGQVWEGVVRLSSNNAAEVAQLGQDKNATAILALPGGGFALREALALGLLRRADLINALAALPQADRPAQLIVPATLAAAFDLRESLGETAIETEPGFSPFAPPLETLLAALRLLPGQALLLSPPLLIFGASAWLWGMIALLLSGLGIGLLWKILPGPALVRGLTLGLLLSAILLALAPDSVSQTWPRLIGFALAPAWYSFLLRGSRP